VPFAAWLANLPFVDHTKGALERRLFSHFRDMLQSPWYYWPDPDKVEIKGAKAERIVGREPGQYFMVGRKPDGTVAEFRLMPYDPDMDHI
jgi:hypothetical protein